jgi:hypothetical protein
MIRIIPVNGSIKRVFLWPLENPNIFNTVLWQSWSVSNCTQREVNLLTDLQIWKELKDQIHVSASGNVFDRKA